MKRTYLHLDSGESIFFERQLEHVKAKSYDKLYPDLMARTLIPVSMDAGNGAETIKYEQFDSVQMAKILASYSDDIPRSDIKGKEFVSMVRGLASSYGYSVQDIRAAKMAGKNLEQRKSNSAKEAILRKENNIAFTGDSEYGLLGLINHPNISSTTLPNDGTGASILWSTKTPALIVRDMHKVANYVVENTKNVEKPDTMLLPLDKFNYIASTPWSTGNDGKTILKHFLETSQYIKEVHPLNELKNAGAGGAIDRMVVYKKDAEKLTLEIPQDYEQFDAEQRGLNFVVPCHARCGGVIIYYPLSVCYADGF